MIPKKIFQTHKSLQHIINNSKLSFCTNSWKKLAPEYEYNFYNNDQCDDFMKRNYGGPVYKAYKRSPLRVMKADIWRYCIIHHFGGIYADSDTRLLTTPDIFQKDNALLIGVPEPFNFYLCQWVFAAPKASPVLESIIDHIAECFYNIDNFNHNDVVHILTGPGAFTQGIEKYLKNNNLPIFNGKCEYSNYPSDKLIMYPHKDFHNNKVQHLYMGLWQGGWKPERDDFLRNMRI